MSNMVYYDKDTPVNASEVVALDFLQRIGRLKDGDRVVPSELYSMLGDALLKSDESLERFVERYSVAP